MKKIGRFEDAVENLIGGVIRLEDFMLVGDLTSNVNGKAQQKKLRISSRKKESPLIYSINNVEASVLIGASTLIFFAS